MRIFLASASSRRRLWLEAQPWVWPHDISVVPMNVDESRVMNISDVSGTVRDVVGLKIESARVLLRGDKDNWVGIVSDTMVENPVSKIPMGKARDSGEAREMLSTLSGKKHRVWTSTGILLPNDQVSAVHTECAEVYFEYLDKKTLDELIESGSWLGKAGSYDIHGEASNLVKVVKGSELTVLGLSESSMVDLRKILEKKS